jgi:hypothetical protein
MGDWWEERDHDRDGRWGAATVGVLLIVLGAAFLVMQQLDIKWQNADWPLYVIVPGAILLLAGLAIPHEAGMGLAIPGGMITTVGLLLAYQEHNDAWASWAYVWPLVLPGSVGASLTLFGILHRNRDILEAGLITAAAGLGIFIVFGLFFVDVIGIDRNHQPEILHQGLPYLSILLGLLIVGVNLLPRRSEASRAKTWSDLWKPRRSGSGGESGDSPDEQSRP